ncbi:MAG: putative sulfate exporter family transporter [Candidatus Aminicenantes bacterium]|nr:MAG: putative sulfate exporter family transporter [Candidatus Aminicenantes bacterium]
MKKLIEAIKFEWRGLIIAIIIGIAAVFIRNISANPVLDPLLVAMTIGIVVRSFMKKDSKMVQGLNLAPFLFIPIGVVIYGAVNLNFVKFTEVSTNYIFLLFLIFLIYIISILWLSNIFGLKKKTGYLVATGSTICGASAIAITSDAIDAEPDEVSTSLISVYISALLGLFVILPVISGLLNLFNMEYGILSGTVLQFTGFVKAAVADLPTEVKTIAISVKAMRYVGLLIIIPLFASFVRRRLHIPWYLWAFLGAGIIFSYVPHLHEAYGTMLKSVLNILWSIAMASIGLSENIRTLFSRQGFSALCVSLISFLIAVGVFIVGLKIL